MRWLGFQTLNNMTRQKNKRKLIVDLKSVEIEKLK